MPMKVNEIRKSFLNFFASKDHLVLPSASLIPEEDPTLLFTSAGMVPFKSYFSGILSPPKDNIASVQKCMRTSDLSEVGKTKRHLCLFEMLGNFSFGGYFKKEAIQFSWEYSTEFLKFPKEQIWITVYMEDEESFYLWKDHIGIPEHKIVRLGKEHNFWGPAGSTGPCGPCSELYLDRGTEFDPQNVCNQPGDKGERFIEYWNLVFNEFDQNKQNELFPLQKKGVDTGAGLERLALLLQAKDSVFDIDEIKKLKSEVCRIYKVSDETDQESTIRILTDHIRTLVFCMADGIYPSNEARGYVLRKILRRAILNGKKIGQKNPILYRLVDSVVEIYGYIYDELKQQVNFVRDNIKQEEKKFLQTLMRGAEKLEEIILNSMQKQNKIISGKNAFLLYDSFGFPLEITMEIAAENGLRVNTFEFEAEMEAQRKRGRIAWKDTQNQLPLNGVEGTRFTGYENIKDSGRIIRIILGEKQVDSISTKDIKKDEFFYIITDQTPFYPESGGQLGDTGSIMGQNFSVEVMDTKKIENIILHICRSFNGTICTGDMVGLEIQESRRNFLRGNHSATHLLNAALRKTLGDHIRQSGSLVHYNYLRFDFTHNKAMTISEIQEVEKMVNHSISHSKETISSVLPIKEAQNKGALMTFGEKYEDIVRVVELGDSSMEFCAGTHVNNTSDIRFFIIIKESSPGSGNRRIDALSGKLAIQKMISIYHDAVKMIDELKKIIVNSKMEREFKNDLKNISNQYISGKVLDIQKIENSNANDLILKWHSIRELDAHVRSLETRIKKKLKVHGKSHKNINEDTIQKILESKKQKNGISIFHIVEENWSIPDLKNLADALREKQPNGVFILQSFQQRVWNAVLASTRSYAKSIELDANDLIKKIIPKLPYVKGGGGGRFEFAQASGKLDASSQQKAQLADEFQNFISGKLK